jgi:parvulin-like peptidyl-prolyl isomerase
MRSRATSRATCLLGAVVLVTLVLTLVSQSPGALAQSADPAADPSLADGAPLPLIVDRVVAVVNDEVVLSTELMMRVAPMAFELNKISDPRERARRQAKLSSQVLDEMVNEQLVTQAAAAAKLDVSAKEVEAAIADLKKQNKLDEDQLAEALRLQGYSMSSYRKDVRNQILRMRAVNTLVRPKVSITEDDVRAKFDEGKRRSSQVSEVHLQHILIAVPKGATKEVQEAARAKATKALELAKGGADFAKLAEIYSDHAATKNTGGDLGWIERGTMPTESEIIVFAMAKGEIRGPINGENGLHIFLVSDVKDTKQADFKSVKERLRNELYRVELDKQTRLWVDELRKKAHYEIKL